MPFFKNKFQYLKNGRNKMFVKIFHPSSYNSTTNESSENKLQDKSFEICNLIFILDLDIALECSNSSYEPHLSHISNSNTKSFV